MLKVFSYFNSICTLAAITHKTTAEDLAFMKTFGSRIRERVAERLDEYRRLLRAAA